MSSINQRKPIVSFLLIVNIILLKIHYNDKCWLLYADGGYILLPNNKSLNISKIETEKNTFRIFGIMNVNLSLFQLKRQDIIEDIKGINSIIQLNVHILDIFSCLK